MSRLYLLLILFGIGANSHAQELEVTFFNDSGVVDRVEHYEVGDMVILAHQHMNKHVHYFEGKVTGIFSDKGVVRVFDYARSERVVSIVGKKIKISEIVGIRMMDEEDYKKRESMAVAASAMSAFGSALGGDAGYAISIGATVAGVGMDVATRDATSKAKVECKILDH